VTLAECVTPPPVAVITIVYVPFLVCFFVATVSVAVPDVNDAGLKVAVVDFGNVPTERATLDPKP
jgi:hypothetical protein